MHSMVDDGFWMNMGSDTSCENKKEFELDDNGNVIETMGSFMQCFKKINKSSPLISEVVEEEYHECPYANNRVDRNGRLYCERKRAFCRGLGFISFEDHIEKIIDRSEMCANASIFGLCAIKISEYEIQAMRDGKVLVIDDGEYTTYIGM